MSSSPISRPSLIPEGLFRTPLVNDKGFINGLVWLKVYQQIAGVGQIPAFISDTHANKAKYAAGQMADGSLYYETDRKVFYVVNGKAWLYLAGAMEDTQANIPIDLGPNDTGFLFIVSDFQHSLRWTGTQFEWGPGDAGSGYVVSFPAGGIMTGWQACDGSVVQVLQSSGIVLPVAVPTIAGSFYRI